MCLICAELSMERMTIREAKNAMLEMVIDENEDHLAALLEALVNEDLALLSELLALRGV